MQMTRTQLTDEIDVSRLIYGMWRLIDGDDSPKTVQAKLEACLEQQITTMDQADIYGDYGSRLLLERCWPGTSSQRQNRDYYKMRYLSDIR